VPLSVARCITKCITKCVTALRTWKAARPRQHWVYGIPPSPTTRPPHLSNVGEVRVVGLGGLWMEKLAGAVSDGWALQMQIQMMSEKELEWGNGYV
jgi:hypothetical protein